MNNPIVCERCRHHLEPPFAWVCDDDCFCAREFEAGEGAAEEERGCQQHGADPCDVCYPPG